MVNDAPQKVEKLVNQNPAPAVKTPLEMSTPSGNPPVKPKEPEGDLIIPKEGGPGGIFGGIDSSNPGDKNTGKVAPEGPQNSYSDQQIEQLWDRAVAANGGKPLMMAKGYYEVRPEHIDPATNPDGILASSTDSTMKLAAPMTVKTTDGQTITLPKGTELPAGVELQPKSILENEDKTRSVDGADLKVRSADGKMAIKLPDGQSVNITDQHVAGKITVADGAKVPAGGYSIARDSVDPVTGEPRVDAYFNKNDADFNKRWAEVPGKPGVFAPQESQMGQARALVQVPADYEPGKMTPNYGGYRDKPVDVKPGDFVLMQRDENGKISEMYRVEEGSGVETYVGVDQSGKDALAQSAEKMRDLGGNVVPAAVTAEEFHSRAAEIAAPLALAAQDVHEKEGESAEFTKVRLALADNADIKNYDKETVRMQLDRLADPVERAALMRQVEQAKDMTPRDKEIANDHTDRGGWTGILSLSPQALDFLASALGI
jgi:hypothetical protein